MSTTTRNSHANRRAARCSRTAGLAVGGLRRRAARRRATAGRRAAARADAGGRSPPRCRSTRSGSSTSAPSCRTSRAPRASTRACSIPLLYKEREDPLRYYVTLDPGYIALGSRANETRAFIDHDCALLTDATTAPQWRAASKPTACRPGASASSPIPDGLGLQLLGVPGGLAGSTVPAGRLVEGEPLVRPRGLAYVVRYVADLERSAAFYRRFFGADAARRWRRCSRSAPRTRAGSCARCRPAKRRESTVSASTSRTTTPPAVTRGLEALGARVVSAGARAPALPLPRRARRRAQARRSGADLGARMSALCLTRRHSVAARRATRRRRKRRAAAARVDAAGRHGARPRRRARASRASTSRTAPSCASGRPTDGPSLELSPILRSLEPFRDRLTS